MSSQLWWYCARAGGIVAWGLLSASVLWGLVMSTKVKPPRVRPAWMLDLHRFLGGLATIFTGVHIGSILLDSYTHFGLADVLVPFASAWHPDRVAWGIVALYVLLTVELTSLARRYLPNKIWRRIHVASLPLYGLATDRRARDAASPDHVRGDRGGGGPDDRAGFRAAQAAAIGTARAGHANHADRSAA